MAAVLSFAILLPAYHHVATRRADRFNSDVKLTDHFRGGEATDVIFHHDQHVYLNLGRLMRINHYHYVVPRQRTPGFPFLLSLFYRDADAYAPDGDDDPRRVGEAYFERAKRFCVLLSMGAIVAVFFLARGRGMPMTESILFTWAVAWLLFVFRAPFVQPEILFQTLALAMFLSLGRQIAAPTWRGGVLAGLAAAAVYGVKSACLPALGWFVAVFGLRQLASLWRGRRREGLAWKSWLSEVAKGAVVPVVFVAALSPYLSRTWRLYGSPSGVCTRPTISGWRTRRRKTSGGSWTSRTGAWRRRTRRARGNTSPNTPRRRLWGASPAARPTR